MGIYNKNNLDREVSIQKFVSKREDWRKISFGFNAGMVFYCLFGRLIYNRLLSASLAFFHRSVLIILLMTFAINFYVGNILSVCPVCGIMIPTTKRRHRHIHEKPSRYGNGPLPDYCPHCGANFVQYKTYEFEQ